MNIIQSTYYRKQHVTGPGCVLVSIKFGVTPKGGVLVVKRLGLNQESTQIKFDIERHTNEILDGVQEANLKYAGNLQVQEIEVVPTDYPKPGQAMSAAFQIAEHVLSLSKCMPSVMLDMKPIWYEFPDIPWGSTGWRMGQGEGYWNKWAAWFKGLEEVQKHSYIQKWQEPKQWAGFYTFIEHGTLPLWMTDDEALQLAAIPPKEDEQVISDPRRIRGLMSHYFSRPVFSIRARDVDLDELYSDPKGFIWGLILSPTGTAKIVKYSGYLIGTDNLEVKQPII